MPPARVRAFGLAVTSCVMALFATAGSSRISGPVILPLSSSHGIHLDDLLVLVCWALSMAWCRQLWRGGS